jgi:hypothetical protein
MWNLRLGQHDDGDITAAHQMDRGAIDIHHAAFLPGLLDRRPQR